MSKPIALILGAGKNIGASTAQMLRAKGFKVALAARSLKPADDVDTVHLTADFSQPNSIISLFASLRQTWGEPSVVLYNAAAAHFTDRTDPLAVSLEDFDIDLAVNTRGVLVAAKETLASFRALPQGPKVFLYTGNALNEGPLPLGMVGAGAGKSAAAHIIATADQAYGEQGFKFYYVDEREADGKPVYSAVDGPAHAEFFGSLIDGSGSAPALATFVKGQGYVSFPRL